MNYEVERFEGELRMLRMLRKSFEEIKEQSARNHEIHLKTSERCISLKQALLQLISSLEQGDDQGLNIAYERALEVINNDQAKIDGISQILASLGFSL